MNLYKGVSYHVGHKKWIAYLRIHGKAIYLGSYDTAEEAAIRYNIAAKSAFGDEVILNEVDMKQSFVMLAHKYTNERVVGWYMSTKLDGMRCIWDGGNTTGMELKDIPWANTEKDSRYINQPKSTGLWTRYGKPIQAPDWFIDQLPPNVILDGELYMGRGRFQDLMSTVKQLQPDNRWKQVEYVAFDSPPVHTMFANREINETNFKKNMVNCVSVIKDTVTLPGYAYKQVYAWMAKSLEHNSYFRVHQQRELPFSKEKCDAMIAEELDKETQLGGEGLMLRNPSSYWTPSRVRTLLKVKGMNDAEGTVIGYTAGRETDKGSKLLGLMGALILNYNGKRLELSGFTDAERQLSHADGTSASALVSTIPGQEVPLSVSSPMFPRGSKVTFKYRELSKDNIPKEARYFRKRPDE